MGADAVVAYFGVNYAIPLKNKTEIASLERKEDSRLLAAKNAGLHTWWGRITDGQPYHLLIGHQLAILGVENETSRKIGVPDLMTLLERTRDKLTSAGFTEEPAVHLLLEAQD
jgi:hypothetical protein